MEDMKSDRNMELDEELAEVLFAISVVARQLARKITRNLYEKEIKDERL